MGRMVAQQFGSEWVDNDELLHAHLGSYSSVREFYRGEGKRAFMDLEFATLKEYVEHSKRGAIISLGGGACDNIPLVEFIKERGKVIYLMVEEPILLKRILKGGVPAFLDASNPEASFAALYQSRHERYGTICDIMVKLPDYPDIRDTAKFLADSLKRENFYGT